MENEYFEIVENELSQMPLGWEHTALSVERDAFAGEPASSMLIALVDAAHVHHDMKELNTHIAKLRNEIRELQTQIEDDKRIHKEMMNHINEKRKICAAQTIFIYKFWEKKNNWTASDAVSAMQFFVIETIKVL